MSFNNCYYDPIYLTVLAVGSILLGWFVLSPVHEAAYFEVPSIFSMILALKNIFASFPVSFYLPFSKYRLVNATIMPLAAFC
jgi:hypothetical protein